MNVQTNINLKPIIEVLAPLHVIGFLNLNKLIKKTDMNKELSKTTQPCTIHSVVCCDSFKEFIPQFGWFKTDDMVCLMPYIQCGEKKMRINHCPSCGKYIRDIQLSEDELLSLIS